MHMNKYRINHSDPESLSLDFIDVLLDGGEKQCPNCGKIKPAREFYKRIDRADGRSVWCKECIKEKDKRHYRSVKRGKERVFINCRVCGKEFWYYKGEVIYIRILMRSLPRLCSQACYYASLRKDYPPLRGNEHEV